MEACSVTDNQYPNNVREKWYLVLWCHIYWARPYSGPAQSSFTAPLFQTTWNERNALVEGLWNKPVQYATFWSRIEDPFFC